MDICYSNEVKGLELLFNSTYTANIYRKTEEKICDF